MLEESTGRAVNVTFTEDAAFWHWAAVETLRHTGLRCEEMLELSQLSIRQYVRPNGEVVALLVVAQRTEVINPETLRAELAKLTDALAVGHPELAGCRFTPHDFRRLFATDLVNHGLPIHIGAALLGHLDVQTTHGYVTVFQEDVIRHHQTHLAGRGPPGRRGNTGRRPPPVSMSTPLSGCPMLHVDPVMIDRLDEIKTDLAVGSSDARCPVQPESGPGE